MFWARIIVGAQGRSAPAMKDSFLVIGPALPDGIGYLQGSNNGFSSVFINSTVVRQNPMK
jgi:hypothetical protein